MALIIQTVKFVPSSDVFAGLARAWAAFSDSEPDCTWGDNSYTLVMPSVVIDGLNDCLGYDDMLDETGIAEVKEVKIRLAGLPSGVYVDLEN